MEDLAGRQKDSTSSMMICEKITTCQAIKAQLSQNPMTQTMKLLLDRIKELKNKETQLVYSSKTKKNKINSETTHQESKNLLVHTREEKENISTPLKI